MAKKRGIIKRAKRFWRATEIYYILNKRKRRQGDVYKGSLFTNILNFITLGNIGDSAEYTRNSLGFSTDGDDNTLTDPINDPMSEFKQEIITVTNKLIYSEDPMNAVWEIGSGASKALAVEVGRSGAVTYSLSSVSTNIIEYSEDNTKWTASDDGGGLPTYNTGTGEWTIPSGGTVVTYALVGTSRVGETFTSGANVTLTSGTGGRVFLSDGTGGDVIFAIIGASGDFELTHTIVGTNGLVTGIVNVTGTPLIIKINRFQLNDGATLLPYEKTP